MFIVKNREINFSVLHNAEMNSHHTTRIYLLNFRSDRIESHHQKMILFPCEFRCFLPASGPGEAPGLEALIEEEKTIAFPEESFDAVSSPAAE